VHVFDIFSIRKLANSNLMQVHMESLIRFSSTTSILLMFLNWCRSLCGWTILSLLLNSFVKVLVTFIEVTDGKYVGVYHNTCNNFHVHLVSLYVTFMTIIVFKK